MVASGGDPEDESLDPELIHDLGLYELHDESRDGDPLGACACPRASPRGREHPPQTREMCRVSSATRRCRAANARQRAWIVSGCRVRRSRNTVRVRRRARPSIRASLSPSPRVPLTGRPPPGERSDLETPHTRRAHVLKKPRGEIQTPNARKQTYCARTCARTARSVSALCPSARIRRGFSRIW